MKKHLITLTLFSGLITLNACKKDAVDYAAQATCTGNTPTYSGEIESILTTHCALSGCHNANSAREDIILSTYTSASSQFTNNANNLVSVHHGSGVKPMPEGGAQLSEDLINKLDCWVKNGCPQ